MKSYILRLFTLTLLVTALTCIPSPLLAQERGKGGKKPGGGNKPPPVVLPIQYRVHELPLPPSADPAVLGVHGIRDVSDTLLVVGSLEDEKRNEDGPRVAYLYDHASRMADTLYDLISPEGLNLIVDAMGTDFDSEFRGVNDWGLAVGFVESVTGGRKGIIVDTTTKSIQFADVPSTLR